MGYLSKLNHGISSGSFDRVDTINILNKKADINTIKTELVSSTNSGSILIDANNASFYKITIDSTTSINLAGFDKSNYIVEVLLEIVNGGSFSVTFPAEVKWITSTGGLASSLSAMSITLTSASDFILLWSTNGGNTVYGKVVR